MTNSGAPQPGATIVQYAGQSPDGTQQFFVPGSQVVVQGIFYLVSCTLVFSYKTFLKVFLFYVDIIALLNKIFMHDKMKDSLRRRPSFSAQ